MKSILMGCIALLLSGCLPGPDFGPTRRPAGDGYYKHSRQGVTLFKIKPPEGVWYTSFPVLIWKRPGTNRGLSFLESSDESIGRPHAELAVYFVVGDSLEGYISLQPYLAQGSAKEWLDLVNRSVPEDQKNILMGDKVLDKAKCFVTEHFSEENARFYNTTYCPGFFRNTFGKLMISTSVGLAEGHRDAAYQRFKEVEPAIQRTFESFRFIEPFSQKIPPGFSMDEQIKRIKAGARPNRQPEFKL